MKIQVHGKASGGFTIAEVSMAVGIVAFGLVAVLSILPFGLTAQKDNREETIIRYEAQYWFAALRAGGLRLDEIDRVERVELTEANGTYYPIPRDEDSVRGWSGDVCDWLSAPEEVGTKFAHVWAFNGSLFDRVNSPGEFSFSYFMESKVEDSGSYSQITLTFHWPITGPIKNALDLNSSSINDIVRGSVAGLTPPANEKVFSIRTSLRPEPMEYKAIGTLDDRQKQFLRAGLPGEEVSIPELEGYFKTIEGPEELKFTRLGSGKINNLIKVPQGAFSKEDIGWHIKIVEESGNEKTYPIKGVADVEDENGEVIGHIITLDFRGSDPVVRGNYTFPYWVTFLDEGSAEYEWEKLLEKWEGQGLGTFDSDKWTFDFISSSQVNGLTPSILK